MFLKRKKVTGPAPQVAGWLVEKIQEGIARCAVYLQQQADKLSVRMLLILLVSFCLVSVSASALLIVRALQKKEMSELPITTIELNPLRLKTGEEKAKRIIQNFDHYLDSLRRRKDPDHLPNTLKR